MDALKTLLYDTAYAGYTLVTVLYLLYAFTRRESFSRAALNLLAASVALHLGSIGLRVVAAHLLPEQSGRDAPWGSWNDSLSIFALMVAVIFLAVKAYARMPILGAFVMPCTWTLLTFALAHPYFSGGAPAVEAPSVKIPPITSDMKSHWLAVHIPVTFLAYAALTNAFGVGLAYLLQERQIKSRRPGELSYRLPSLEDLDRLVARLIYLAFPALTVGLVLGAWWAHVAWGRFWGWDAKETWALITWLVYLAYLVARHAFDWRGRRATYLSLAGFGIVLFTYVGVNYLSELHGFLSYKGR
jgi:cytochrome c-type biogenesis protein CcsB